MGAQTTTYSFEDMNGSLNNPITGPYIFDGVGVGGVDIEPGADVTSVDRAADGSIMVSKIAVYDGTISIQCQQTSDIHKYLLNTYNALVIAPTAMWASMSALFRNVSDGTSHMITGMPFQKKAGLPYKAQGQQITWTFIGCFIASTTA